MLIQFPQSINEENQQNIFQYEIYGTFSRKSRHSTLTVNATVLTRFSVEELTLKQLLIMKSEYRVFRAKGVERPITKYSSLQHVLNVSFWK